MKARIASIKDIEEISEIAKSTFPLACPPESSKFELEKYALAELSSRSFQEIFENKANKLWVAELNAQIVGFCLMHLISKSTAKISKIYVLPEHHGSGAATMLINAAIRFATSNHIKVLILSVFHGNDRAKAFYRKFGFRFIKHVVFQMGEEIHQDDLMELKLHNR